MVTVQLPPPVAPFQRIKNPGSSITINTAGKVLVVPTDDAAKLPSFNRTVLNSNRLTIAESPFGGLKGSGSPDYAVGTIYTPTDGIYITDTAGTNSTKTMTAGKLKELSLLTVSTTAKTITEEIIISNTNTANGTPLSIDPCNDHTGWSVIDTFGSGVSFSSDGSKVTITGTTNASGYLLLTRAVSKDLTNYTFAIFQMASSHAGSAYIGIGSDASNYSRWSGKNCTALAANTQASIVLPFRAPVSATSTVSNPNLINGSPAWASTAYIRVGFVNASYPNTQVTLTLYDISADVGKEANVEINIPDNLTDTSVSVQVWDGSAYQVCRTCKLDSTFADVSTTPANVKMLDGTKFDDVYGSGLGRAVFPKGIGGATVTGSTGTMTFSANKGTKYRIGKMVMLPPSDGGRTTFNQIRLKFIIYFSDTQGNKIPDLSGNGKYATLSGLVTKLSVGVKPDGSTGVIATPITSLPDEYEMTLDVDLAANTTNALISKNHNTGYARDLTVSVTAASKIDAWLGNDSTNYINPVSTLTVGTGRHTFRIVKAARNLKIYYDGTLYIDADFTFALTMSADILKLLELTSSSSYRKANTLYSFKLTSGGSTLLYYSPQSQNSGSTTYEFDDSTNASYGLQNMTRPWIALYSLTENYIDFFLFTHRPKNLIRKRDDSGNIHELTLYAGNGAIYRGRITHANLTADSNSDTIPDCLEAAVAGSITKFLACYGMVI